MTFQAFVNGEIPVKEAVVYRTLSNTNGKVVNQEWLRFGYQTGTWYVQRLEPDPDNSTRLVPKQDHHVCGASLRELWTMDNTDIHLVDKAVATGSIPDTFGEVFRNLMFSALSLGLPRQLSILKLEDADIKWSGLTFKTKVESKWNLTGTPLATAVITGKLVLGDDGLPISAVYPGIDQRDPGSITYQYSSANTGIPSSFVARFGRSIYHYTFLSLTFGTNDLTQTGGYAPSMFGDMKISRAVTIWTNSLSWSLRDGTFHPDFVIAAKTKQIGSLVLISLAVMTGILLTLWYQRSKKVNNKQNNNEE